MKRNSIQEDKRITEKLLDLWHQASGENENFVSNRAFSDPQWSDEWYMVNSLEILIIIFR